jgi:hypothetical protein
MGRPLKIYKTNGSTPVDEGFPNDGSTDNGYVRTAPGVVGGIMQQSSQIECNARILVKGLGTITTATNSTGVTGTGTSFTTDAFSDGNTIVYAADGATQIGILSSVTDAGDLVLAANAAVAVTNSAWYYSTESNQSSIVRQKGAKKFLAVTQVDIQDESIAKGQAYMINSVSNTNWAALGADVNATHGDIFTAMTNGTGLTTNGTVWAVGICILVNESAPAEPNTMSITQSQGTETVSRIKNKYATDFSTPYANCNPGTVFSATFGSNGATLPNPATSNDFVYTTSEIENWC